MFLLLLSYERPSSDTLLLTLLGLDSVQAAWLPDQDDGEGEHDAPKKPPKILFSVVTCSNGDWLS